MVRHGRPGLAESQAALCWPESTDLYMSLSVLLEYCSMEVCGPEPVWSVCDCDIFWLTIRVCILLHLRCPSNLPTTPKPSAILSCWNLEPVWSVDLLWIAACILLVWCKFMFLLYPPYLFEFRDCRNIELPSIAFNFSAHISANVSCKVEHMLDLASDWTIDPGRPIPPGPNERPSHALQSQRPHSPALESSANGPDQRFGSWGMDSVNIYHMT